LPAEHPAALLETQLRVRFFGRLADSVGRELLVSLPLPCSVAGVRSALAAVRPDAASALLDASNRACVDDEIMSEASVVRPGATIEFLPPLSGG